MIVEMADGKEMTIEVGIINKIKKDADEAVLQEIENSPKLCEMLNDVYFITAFPRYPTK